MRQAITFTILALFLSITTSFSQLTESATDFIKNKTEKTAQNVSDSTMPLTSIEFKTTEFNWGSVNEGEKIQNVFEFTNTGDEPLIIINAKGSCGCTIPRFPKEPIMPGETANLLVQFDSKKKGKVGGGLQSKRVTITANTEPQNSYLTIKGTVYKQKTAEEMATRSANFDIDAASINIFPNPSTDIIKLNIQDYAGQSALVEIYNTMGQKLNTKMIQEISEQDEEFDVSTYTTGTYTMSIKIEGLNRIAKQFHVL